MFPQNLSRRTAGLAVFASLAVSGCVAYHPQPLDLTAVNAALQPVPLDSVRISAANFAHPLLQPLQIDGRDGFSPDEIALMTVIVSPQLRALRAQRGVARAQIMQAGILPNPQLSYALDAPHDNAAPALGPANTLGLSWEVTSLLTRPDNIAGAKAQAEALDLSIAWQEWQAAQDARLRAFRVLSLEARLPLAREIETNLKDSLELTRQAVDLHYRTSGELTALQSAWSDARDNRFVLEQEITSDRLALNLALGVPTDQTLKLKAAAVFPVLPPDAQSAVSLLQGMEKRRLDLVALSLGYASQEASLRAAVKSQFPKIGLSLARANDTSNVKTLGFGVQIDVPLFDRNQGQIAIGEATRQQLFDEYVARVSEARGQVAQILANLAITRAQLQSAEEAFPALQQRFDAMKEALQAQRTDVLAYRDAASDLASNRILQGKLQQDVLELGVALEIATGRPLLNRPSAQ